ncbi:MAG TPA: LuxR C-terminal-related transcriptional regulator [Patescibacteria group bacterium]|nr:LuxR C-terminal-related transcriptional regulator [Patescibacteria group bacterium]
MDKLMDSTKQDDPGRKASTGEVRETLIEIEHLLKELERSKSVAAGENLSARLEMIEQKLGRLESLVGTITTPNPSAHLNYLIEEIIASRIRSDLESSVQSLHLVQSYLLDHSRDGREIDHGVATTSPPVEHAAQPIDECAQPGETGRGAIAPVTGSALERMLERAIPEDRREIEDLSRRKRETLYHLLLGKSNREIAEELGVTEKTVKNNLYAIYQILRVRSRSQLIHRLLNPISVEITPAT